MKWFLGTYTARFNRRHKLCGHLFSGRYKSLIVDGSGNGYLRTVCEYVHLNPHRARLLSADQALREFTWSSCLEYLKAPKDRPPWLRVDRLFGEMGIPRDSAAGRRQFERILEQRRAQETGADWKDLRRGWCLGEEAFRQELLEQAHGRAGENHPAQTRRETAEEKARRIIGEELARLHWRKEELARSAKGDARKVRIAGRLRAETTVPLKWIAQELNMGVWTHVANRLYHAKTSGA
jgi:hypothetical protein